MNLRMENGYQRFFYDISCQRDKNSLCMSMCMHTETQEHAQTAHTFTRN